MRNLLRGLALVFGLAAIFAGFLIALVAGFVWITDRVDLGVSGATIALSTAALSIGLGALLAAAAAQALRGHASPRLRLPPPWLLGLAFLAFLAVGQLVLHTSLAVALLPPLHVLTSLMPVLLLAAAVAMPLQRAGAGLTRRHFGAHLAYGGLGATLVAAAIEMILVIVAVVVGLIVASMMPGGEARLQALSDLLNQGSGMQDFSWALPILHSPLVVTIIGVFVAVLVPLIEETAKSLPVLSAPPAPSHLRRARFFAAGVFAGLGFSLTEALFYAAQQLPDAWANGVLLRALTVLIHATATGMMALGWYEVKSHRGRQAALYLLGGVSIHAVWNGLSSLTAFSQLQSLLDKGPALSNGLLAAGSVILLALVWFVTLAVLVGQTRALCHNLRVETRVDAPAG